MSSYLRSLTIVILVSLFSLSGCADYTPKEPPLNSGTVFQQPLEAVQTAVRDALTKLSFAIIKENDQYIEAVHLKPGETAEKNKSELVAVWMKPRSGATLVLIDTVKRASGIAKQKEWEQPLMLQIMKNLQ